MAEQLRRHPMPSTTAIGVDEIAIRKGHEYRVVVSDLERQRTDLVRRRGTQAGGLGAILCGLRYTSLYGHSYCGAGYVETVLPSDTGTRPAGRDRVRQIPHLASS